MKMSLALLMASILMGSVALAQTPKLDEIDGAPRSYIIGPQDHLSITVFDEPSLTGKYRVENDGYFTFPLLNRVPARGKTIGELQSHLTTLLANGYLRSPQVRIEIDQYKSQRVIVTGQVRTPGEVPMTGATMTLLTALAVAGSPTADASDEVILVHPPAPGEAEGETIRINRRDLELGRAGMDIVLRDGDIINVPKAQTFFITGEVRTPGTYVLASEMTVEQAIALAGGLAERGSDRGISVTRTVNGRSVDVAVKLQDRVQPNDTIKIRPRFF